MDGTRTHVILIDNQELWPLSYHRKKPSAEKPWCAGQDLNLQRPQKEIPGYGRIESTVSQADAHLEERTRVERAMPEGTSVFKTGRLANCRTSPKLVKATGGSGASRTLTSRRYVPLRTGWACHMPNASVAEEARLELAGPVKDGPRSGRVSAASAQLFRAKWRR